MGAPKQLRCGGQRRQQLKPRFRRPSQPQPLPRWLDDVRVPAVTDVTEITHSEVRKSNKLKNNRLFHSAQSSYPNHMNTKASRLLSKVVQTSRDLVADFEKSRPRWFLFGRRLVVCPSLRCVPAFFLVSCCPFLPLIRLRGPH